MYLKIKAEKEGVFLLDFYQKEKSLLETHRWYEFAASGKAGGRSSGFYFVDKDCSSKATAVTLPVGRAHCLSAHGRAHGPGTRSGALHKPRPPPARNTFPNRLSRLSCFHHGSTTHYCLPVTLLWRSQIHHGVLCSPRPRQCPRHRDLLPTSAFTTPFPSGSGSVCSHCTAGLNSLSCHPSAPAQTPLFPPFPIWKTSVSYLEDFRR